MVVLVQNDKNMVVEDGCGYFESVKKNTIHFDRYAAIKKELQEEAELNKLGLPSADEISRSLGIPAEAHKKFLDNDIPVPASQMETATIGPEIESFLPSEKEIMESLGISSEQNKKHEPVKAPKLDEIPSETEIMEQLGIKKEVISNE